MDDNDLQFVITKVRILLLCLGFFCLLEVLAHVKLKRVLVAVIDLKTVPGDHVVLDARQVEGEDRRQALQLWAFHH